MVVMMLNDDIVVSRRFDVCRAYKPGIMQAVRDKVHAGGHVYGYGTYFAAHALYSHWWNTRVWNRSTAARLVYAL